LYGFYWILGVDEYFLLFSVVLSTITINSTFYFGAYFTVPDFGTLGNGFRYM